MNEARPKPRAGFTLVELLMVILIIALLMGLLLPAVNAVRIRARVTQLRVDLGQIANGLKQAQAGLGGLPASTYWHPTQMRTFLRRAFPRYQPTTGQLQILQDPLANPNSNGRIDAAEALVFWLGGIWDGNRMTGFSADPRNPLAAPPDPADTANPPTMLTYDRFGTNVVSTDRKSPFFDFEETRLADVDNDGFPEYYPPDTNLSDAKPYVLFVARPNQTYWLPDPDPNQPPTNIRGTSDSDLPFYQHPPDPNSPTPNKRAVPYLFSRDGQTNTLVFVEQTGFQLILAGIDDEYGPGVRKWFSVGIGYGAEDEDNMTSFAETTLGDARQ